MKVLDFGIVKAMLRAASGCVPWIGSAGKAMLGLWAALSAPQAVTLHTTFRVSSADVLAAPEFLRNAGITPLHFDGKPTDRPVVLAWMPAAAVYFRDPDGHLLEYIAMLPHEARPDCGVVPWRTWELMQHASTEGPRARQPEQSGVRSDLNQSLNGDARPFQAAPSACAGACSCDRAGGRPPPRRLQIRAWHRRPNPGS